MKIIVFLGAPGSGKGTQAKRLASKGKFIHLSTGDLLRTAISQKTTLGIQAKEFMDKGALVPDLLMINLISNTLSELPKDTQILLDGFPRTVPQAQALDQQEKTRVSIAIYFKTPEEVLMKRLTGRRICKKCGELFHLHFLPPVSMGKCDKCGSELIQRTDDSESVAKHRLQVFRTQNESLLSYYQTRNNLKEFNADEDVFKIETTLSSLLS